MSMDWMIARLDNHILVDGKSQRQFLIRNRIITEKQSRVLGEGSISGVNIQRFTPIEGLKPTLRREIGIDEHKIVFTFMGRLNRDKGVYELFAAFNRLIETRPKAYLLFIGNDEEDCLLHVGDYTNIVDGTNFKFYGRTPEPGKVLQVSDVFCLPSHREGFGSSVLEASCLGLPVVCSDAYGLMDAMVDKETGLRCKVGDADSLYEAMYRLYDSKELRETYGRNGRERTLRLFAADLITKEWVAFYKQLFND